MSAPVEITAAPTVLPPSAYLAARPPRYRLYATTVIARPLDEVFGFFSAASNLAAITPPDMGFAIIAAPPAMAAGAVIDYRVHVLRVPIRWRTIIDAWEPPDGTHARFVDSQARGPYACWWHEHAFTRDGDRTIMVDTVLYAPPLGPLGAIANRLLIARELRRIFGYRATVIAARFGGPRPVADAYI